MRLREFVKEHKWGSAATSILAALLWWIGLVGVPESFAQVVRWVGWMLNSSLGKALATFASLGIIVAFWVVYPWLVSRTTRAKVGAIRNQLDELASINASETVGESFVEVAVSAGNLVIKARELGAFSHIAIIEHYVDCAKRGQLWVQISADSGRKHPASMAEYQALWAANAQLVRTLGYPSDADSPSLAATRRACHNVSAHLRARWKLAPPKWDSVEPASTTSCWHATEALCKTCRTS